MSVAIFKGKLVKFLAKAGILVPTRTELERPDTPAAGEMAFNTDSNALEVYTGSNWAGVESSVTETLLPQGDPFSSVSFLDTSFRRLTGSGVYATDASSSIYVANVGAAINNDDLSNLNAFYIDSNTGALQNLKLCFDDQVDASYIVGTSAYFAGKFTSFNGQYAPGIAKVSLITGLLDTTFVSGVGTGFDNTQYELSIAYDDISNNLIIAGYFTSWNGSSVNSIIAINRNSGALDATFMSNVGSGFNNRVDAMTYSEGAIYCAGIFTSFNGTTRNKLVKLQFDGQLIASFDPGTGYNGTVYGLKVGGQYGGVYVFGSNLSSYNGTSVSKVFRLNSSTAALDTSFSPSVNFDVYDVQPIGADVFIGGTFTTVNGVSKPYIAKLDGANATLDPAFPNGTGFNTYVQKLSEHPQLSNQIIAAGTFTLYNGSNFGGIVSLNTSTGIPLSGFNAPIGFKNEPLRKYLNINYSGSDSNILVTGQLHDYDNINNWTTGRICKLNPNGTIDTSFNPDISWAVTTLELDGLGSLYIGGYFDTVNGVYRDKLAKISAIDGSLDTNFVVGTGPSSAPLILKVDTVNNALYLGGFFTDYNGTTSNRIAKVDASTGALDLGFSSIGGANEAVRSIVIDSNQDIYLGGDFNTYGPDFCPKVVKIDKTGARILEFTTNVSYPSANVYSMALDASGNLFIGGSFSTYGGVSAPYVAKLDATTAALDTGFYSLGTISGSVNGLAFDQSSNSLYVGGSFTSYGGVSVLRLAKLNASTGELDTSFNSGSGFPVTISSLKLTDYGLIVEPYSSTPVFYNNQYLSLIYVDKQTSSPITAFYETFVNYTLQQSNNYTTFLVNTADASVITIPAGLPTGFKFKVVQLGSGSISILGAGSVVINNSGGITSTSVQYESLEVTSYAADTYLLTIR